MSLIEGAPVEPSSVGVHAVRQSLFQPEGDVVVVGAGPITPTVIQAARAAGSGCIFASEPSDDRRQLASSSGADLTVDSLSEGVAAETNIGADIALEVAGVEPALNQAVKIINRGGTRLSSASSETAPPSTRATSTRPSDR